MKRHIAARLAVAERAKHPPFSRFVIPGGEVLRDNHLPPGQCYLLNKTKWLMDPEAFSQIAIKLGAWTPPELLDAHYRHPRAVGTRERARLTAEKSSSDGAARFRDELNQEIRRRLAATEKACVMLPINTKIGVVRWP